MIRQVVRGIGKTLICTGVLILLFVVYQLWGTGVAQARAQKKLRSEFTRQLAAPAAAEPVTPASPDTTAAPTTTVPVQLAEGDAAGVILIPKIGLDQAFIEGVGVEELKQAVGHYPDTKMPGEKGNAALAGHRTTYGAPFNRLDELVAGDAISVTTQAGTFRYEVTEKRVVTPDEISVLDDTPDNRLTLTTCHPKYSAEQRLIVFAQLVGPPVGEPVAPVDGTATTTPPRTRELAAGVDRPGLSGAGATNRPAIAWGILAASVWLSAWAVGRWTGRRWTAYMVGAPIFFVVLFVFFENVARLLPANV
ncbi:MAG TPA: class E sortase [Acidimicrobiales bacterium]|nr:class E sortase [Acidimicrobiales bacterium]